MTIPRTYPYTCGYAGVIGAGQLADDHLVLKKVRFEGFFACFRTFPYTETPVTLSPDGYQCSKYEASGSKVAAPAGIYAEP